MPAAVAGPEIERLIQLLARLPGLGPRSARRAALFLIKKREQIMAPLGAALERAHVLDARYHVLGGTLSPLDGVGPEDLSIQALVTRAHDPAVKEVVLALDATVEGQTTAHYITDLLRDAGVKVTRLAHGLPV